jgi:hypothetical protein
LSREDGAIVELAGFNKDLVAKHEVPERDHHRRRRFLEHPDDDAIVGSNSSTRAVHSARGGHSPGRVDGSAEAGRADWVG